MIFEAGLKWSYIKNVGHRPHLVLNSRSGDLKYEIRSGTGAYNHLLAEQLRDVDWDGRHGRCLDSLDRTERIKTIELDEDELLHLALFRVS